MTDRLPLAFKPILDAEQNRPLGVDDGPLPHYYEFVTGTRSLASFASTGPILTPTVGQQIRLHGVGLRVTEVEPAYEVNDRGQAAVHTTVVVELAEED